MEESTAQPFPTPEDEGYARVGIDLCEAAEFLMTKLEQVNLHDLDPDDRICEICQEQFHVSEDVRLQHAPVKTPCGHIFGDQCIMKWLDLLCFYRGESDDGSEADDDALIPLTYSSCPKCQHVFFKEFFQHPMQSLYVRLCFWDMAYIIAGVRLSEKEKRTRKYLWAYVRYCKFFEYKGLDDRKFEDLQEDARLDLLYFADFLTTQDLTPAQEIVRQQVEELAGCHMSDGDYDPDDGNLFEEDAQEDEDQRSETDSKPNLKQDTPAETGIRSWA